MMTWHRGSLTCEPCLRDQRVSAILGDGFVVQICGTGRIDHEVDREVWVGKMMVTSRESWVLSLE